MNNLSKYRVLIGQMYALATAMGVKAEDKWAEVKAFFNSVAYWNFDEKCTGAAPAPATPAKKDDKKPATKKDEKKPAKPAKKDRILQAPVKKDDKKPEEPKKDDKNPAEPKKDDKNPATPAKPATP